jgi:hypothetical protein
MLHVIHAYIRAGSPVAAGRKMNVSVAGSKRRAAGGSA